MRIVFDTNVIVAGVLCLLLAVLFDVVLLTAQRVALPWQRVQAGSGPRTRRLWREARVMD